MKKYIYPTIMSAIILIAYSFTIQGDSDTRTLDNFSSIDISSGITVTLIKSSSNKAEVKTEGVETSDIITVVKDGELDIKYKKKFGWTKNRKAWVNVSYSSEIENIDISSGSSLSSEGTISTDNLKIDVSSGSSVSVDVDVEDLVIDVSSGASVMVTGKCEDQNVDLSSGSSYKAEGLASNSADIDASSGASARIWVTDKLTASASSGASIRYKGDPSTKNVSASKYSGSIKKM